MRLSAFAYGGNRFCSVRGKGSRTSSGIRPDPKRSMSIGICSMVAKVAIWSSVGCRLPASIWLRRDFVTPIRRASSLCDKPICSRRVRIAVCVDQFTRCPRFEGARVEQIPSTLKWMRSHSQIGRTADSDPQLFSRAEQLVRVGRRQASRLSKAVCKVASGSPDLRPDVGCDFNVKADAKVKKSVVPLSQSVDKMVGFLVLNHAAADIRCRQEDDVALSRTVVIAKSFGRSDMPPESV